MQGPSPATGKPSLTTAVAGPRQKDGSDPDTKGSCSRGAGGTTKAKTVEDMVSEPQKLNVDNGRMKIVRAAKSF